MSLAVKRLARASTMQMSGDWYHEEEARIVT